MPCGHAAGVEPVLRLFKDGFGLSPRLRLMLALAGADKPSEPRPSADDGCVRGVPYPDPEAEESSHVVVCCPGRDRFTADSLGEGIGDPRSGVRGAIMPSSCCRRFPARAEPGMYDMTGARRDLTRDVRPAGGEEK